MRLPHHGETIGIGIAERPDQGRVHHGKDGCVGADPNRERQNCGHGKAAVFRHHAKRETQVRQQFIRPSQA